MTLSNSSSSNLSIYDNILGRSLKNGLTPSKNFKSNNPLTQELLKLLANSFTNNPESKLWVEKAQNLLVEHAVPANAQESAEFLQQLTEYLSATLSLPKDRSSTQNTEEGFADILAGKRILSMQESNLSEVAKLQDLLRKCGYFIEDHHGKYRGVFGPQTEKALKSFQKTAGLHVDGVVGVKTLTALLKIGSVELPEGIGLKPGAVIHSLHPKMVETLPHIEKIWKQFNAPKPVITSGNDSKHQSNSKHYSNRALDLRGKNISDAKLRLIGQELQSCVGSDYRVLVEIFPEAPSNDHIHIQYNGP